MRHCFDGGEKTLRWNRQSQCLSSIIRSSAILDKAFEFVIDKSDVLRRAVRGRKIGWGQMAEMSFLSLGLEFKWEEARALRLVISGHCTPCELQLMITDSRRLVFPEPTYIVS